MCFGMAINALMSGEYIARKGWHGKSQYLFHVSEWACKRVVDGVSVDMKGQPFIAMSTVQKKAVPWVASQADMHAEDWEVVE